MKYQNKKERRFRSDQFIFRQTALGEALRTAGVTTKLRLVRESKVEWPVRENGNG